MRGSSTVRCNGWTRLRRATHASKSSTQVTESTSKERKWTQSLRQTPEHRQCADASGSGSAGTGSAEMDAAATRERVATAPKATLSHTSLPSHPSHPLCRKIISQTQWPEPKTHRKHAGKTGRRSWPVAVTKPTLPVSIWVFFASNTNMVFWFAGCAAHEPVACLLLRLRG